MKNILISSFVSLVVGIIVGVLATIFFYPFIFPPAEVNEIIMDKQSKHVIAAATFIHPDPSDRVHWGKGGVEIYRQDNAFEIFLDSGFEVGPGPAYYLYLSRHSSITNNNDFKQADNIEIGRLKSFKGSQVYIVPAGSNINNAKSVVVWCKAFKQLITSASLSTKP